MSLIHAFNTKTPVTWLWHWNPRKWHLIRYWSPSRKFVYVQVGPLVRMGYVVAEETDE